MADNKKTFIQRVVSGFLGAGAIIALGVYGGTIGLDIICTMAIILGMREFSRMIFQHWPVPFSVSALFWLVAALYFAQSMYYPNLPPLAFGLANLAFLVGSLWLARARSSNENILGAMAMGCFGLLYCVYFPLFALKIIHLQQGPQWFFYLLVLVFFGDTFAYFGGRFFGERKLMVQVSPNKTWAGTLSGLVGSCVAGVLYVTWLLPSAPLGATLGFCLVCGIVAQSGDLLMSLVKRVAHVKDSGHIMPGHGGILDRLDGIFIACPLVYIFALYCRG